MKEEGDVFKKFRDSFSKMDGHFHILEQRVPVELQMEYFKYSEQVRKERAKPDLNDMDYTAFRESLSNPESTTDYKKYILSMLATSREVKAYRMLEDYEKQYYVPMSARYQKMIENDFAMAAEIAEWKKKISREWDNIELVGLDLPNRSKQIIALGKSYYGEVKLEIGELSMHEVGVELVAAEQKDGRQVIREKHDFIPVEQVGSVARYRIDVTADSPGLLMLAIRIYPKSELLPHRQDFALVKWL